MTALTPDAPRARNPFAVASIAIAVVLVVVTLAGRVVAIALPAIVQSAHLPVASIAPLLSATGIVGLVLAIAAAALGIMGVTRTGLPHGLAAAGMAIGITSAATFVLVSALDAGVAAALVPR